MRFDYYCPKCDKEKLDVEHGMNEKPEIRCECGELMRKKVSANYHWSFNPLQWSFNQPKKENK